MSVIKLLIDKNINTSPRLRLRHGRQNASIQSEKHWIIIEYKSQTEISKKIYMQIRHLLKYNV